MKKLIVFAGMMIFWYFYFVLARVIFLIYNLNLTKSLKLRETFLTFFYGFKLDISFVSYISVLTALLFGFLFFMKGKTLYKIIFYYFIFLSIILSAIVVIDCELYRNWGFRIDATPFYFLKNPNESLASTPVIRLLILVLLIVVLSIITILLFKKIFKQYYEKFSKGHFLEIILYAIIIVLLVIPIRGGIKLAPLNAGCAYFSNKQFANHAALNAAWNLSKALLDLSDPDPFINKGKIKESVKIVDSMDFSETRKIECLNLHRPNILFLVMESIPARLIDTIIEGHKVCPNLSALKEQSIYFTNFYANGDRSEKGLVSIFSAYPNQAHTSIMKYPEKTQKLNFISKELIDLAYNGISFYYGGNIDFANMRSYFYNGRFRKLISEDDFEKWQLGMKWGVHDEFVLEKWLNDINKLKSPFFSACFTLSSHEPFDTPSKPILQKEDESSKFINAVHYTDSCIGSFLEKARKTSWWDSTLIILVSDHGHRYPGDIEYFSLEKFHIPMFWTGGALSKKGIKINKNASQIDIVPSLMGQMDLNKKISKFGHDFYSNSKESQVLYCFNLGFGYLENNAAMIYDVKGKRIINSSGKYSENFKKSAFSLYDVIHYDFFSK
jgi:phosphoglycerol transferase MdoB-like AlkP superfamily enzyme